MLATFDSIGDEIRDLESEGRDVRGLRNFRDALEIDKPKAIILAARAVVAAPLPAKPQPETEVLRGALKQMLKNMQPVKDPGPFPFPTGITQMSLGDQTFLTEERADQLARELFSRKAVVNEGSEKAIAEMLQDRGEANRGAERSATVAAKRARRVSLDGDELYAVLKDQIFPDLFPEIE